MTIPNHSQLVCTVSFGQEIGGYVVIDSTVAGRSCGGLRMLPDVDEAEMRGLARAMTLKYGFLGLPQGGAKAGVRGDPEAPEAERRQTLARFAQAIAPLLQSGLYVPGTDMGTNNSDIVHVLRTARVPIRRRWLRGTQSGYYTSLTVMAGVRQAARLLDIRLAGASAAIEGFGSVGSALGALLDAAGVRVVAVSTASGAIYHPEGLDVAALRRLAQRDGAGFVCSYAGAQQVDRGAFLELPVDLLCPCARHHSVRADNAPRIQARAVCPGANNPLTREAEDILAARNVLCLPDFVTNCGGVLGGTMEFASISRPRIEGFIREEIDPRIASLLEAAGRQGVLPRQVAETAALGRFEDVQRRATQPSPIGRLFQMTLELYRHGWIPGRLVAPLAISYFRRCLS
jgi:glutamate dehydrogenase/leucine dehydrogenase